MRTFSRVTIANPRDVSLGVSSEETLDPSPLPQLLHASEKNCSAFNMTDSDTGSKFTATVNLLGAREQQTDDSTGNGIPPQRQHVVYELSNGLFVSRSLRKELLATGAMEHKQPGVNEAQQRLALDGTGNCSRVVYTEDVCGLVKVLLKKLLHLELTVRSLASGAALLSLFGVLFGGHLNTPLDNSLLWYLVAVHSFEPSVFLFLLLLLLTAALAPLASGVADAKWRMMEPKQTRSLDDHSRHQHCHQQHQQRRPLSSHVTFAEHSLPVGATFLPVQDQGVSLSATDILPAGRTSIVGFDQPMHTLNSAISRPSASKARSDGCIANRLAAAENSLAQRLLQRTANRPWAVLLNPVVWAYMAGLVLTVVEISFTEDQSSQDMADMNLSGGDGVHILLFAVLCIRAALLLPLPLLDLLK